MAEPLDRPEPVPTTDDDPLGVALEILLPEAVPEDAGEATQPGQSFPGTEKAPVNELGLTLEEVDELGQQLIDDVLIPFDEATEPLRQRWAKIEEAYDQEPDTERQGISPNAARLVSLMTRIHVRTAAARITSGILDTKPTVKVKVYDPHAEEDERTEMLNELADAMEALGESYMLRTVDFDRKIPNSILRACKLGDAFVRLMWEDKKDVRMYRDASGDIQEEEIRDGRVVFESIPATDFVAWPVNKECLSDCTVVGHRSYLRVADFIAQARKWGMSDEEIKEITERESEEVNEADQEKARRRDLYFYRVPGTKEICVTNLWCDWRPEGKDKSIRFIIVLHEELRKVLAIERNTNFNQRHPYFQIPYVTEEGFIFNTGIGQELMYPQAAASTLKNLLFDNLSVIAHHVRKVRVGSTAEAHLQNIGPGYNLPVDEMDDFQVEALGGDLSNIYSAIGFVETEAMQSSGVSEIMQGRGDTALKSGASTGSYQMLLEQGAQKFGRIDADIRQAMTDMYTYVFELIIQYAPDEMFSKHVSRAKAQTLKMIRFFKPGDLEQKFRLEIQAPSAATNKEVQKQNLLIINSQLTQQAQVILQLAQMAYQQTNPAGLERFMQAFTTLLVEILDKIMEIHDLRGFDMPTLGPPTPADERINQLMQQLQQTQQQMQQIMQQVQQAAGQQQGGMGGGGAAPGGAPPIPQG